jgi:hypothetical protein
MSSYVVQGSKTDPRGVVKALFQENTFTEIDDFIEIYQNSDDASSKNMKVRFIKYKDKTFLFISDDGIGMDLETMDMSLNLLGETKGEKKHGKFNFGGKAGILHLSGINDYLQSKCNYRGKCIVISNNSECEPVCYEMSGKELIERGWDGQVKPVIIGSGDESRDSGTLYEEYPIENTGTHIFIELTEWREKKLREIEYDLRKTLSLACNERLNHCSMSICFNDTDDGLLKYTPILKSDIIDEKKHTTHILVYMKDTEKIYVVEDADTNYTIKSISEKRKSYSKTLQVIKDEELDGYEKKGTFILSSACDYEYIRDEKTDSLSTPEIYVVRNEFCLNKYNIPKLDKKTRQGDYYIRTIYRNTKSTLTYESNDIMDSLIGINMQKADIKFEKLDKAFQRTIEQLVLKHADIFIKYIRENEYEPQQEVVQQEVVQQEVVQQEVVQQEVVQQEVVQQEVVQQEVVQQEVVQQEVVQQEVVQQEVVQQEVVQQEVVQQEVVQQEVVQQEVVQQEVVQQEVVQQEVVQQEVVQQEVVQQEVVQQEVVQQEVVQQEVVQQEVVQQEVVQQEVVQQEVVQQSDQYDEVTDYPDSYSDSDSESYISIVNSNEEDQDVISKNRILSYLNSDEVNTELIKEILEVMNKYGK